MDLEIIEKKLEIIEETIQNQNVTNNELLESKKQIIKIIKHLMGIKNYLKKQKNADLTKVKELLEEARNCEDKIYRIKQDKKVITEKEKTSKKINQKPITIPELLQIDSIMQSDMEEIEKIKKLEEILMSAEQTIYYFIEQNKELIIKEKECFPKENNHHKTKKERLESKHQEKKTNKIPRKKFSKNIYDEYHKVRFQIKENVYKIQEQRIILQKCKSCLINLKKKEKIQTEKTLKKPKLQLEKGNKYYYLIFEKLLEDDKNYLLLKEILLENESFLNARNKDEHIIFKILDQYIYNQKLELVNQKIVHQNPNYFYSLLKLMASKVNLTYEEELRFSKIIGEFIAYLYEKNYSDAKSIIQKIREPFSKEKRDRNTSLNKNELLSFMEDSVKNKNRTNLSKNFLSSIYSKVAIFKDEYFNKYLEMPTEETIKESLGIKINDIRNSNYIGSNFTFEGQKYAFSISYNENYEMYFRIHVMDTTFLAEEIPWQIEMGNSLETIFKSIKRVLTFKEKGIYPTMTYQFKISKNGEVMSFKIFESIIKIDKKIMKDEFKNYRYDNELKTFVGGLKCLANYFNSSIDTFDLFSTEKIVDSILNIELLNYYKKYNLPSLTYVEFEMSEEEKINLHTEICYYLSKIPKTEAHALYRHLRNSNTSKFYSTLPIAESVMELDTRNYLGYLNLSVLKQHLYNHQEEIKYLQEFMQDCIEKMNNDDIYLDYFNGRKLIRMKKAERIS